MGDISLDTRLSERGETVSLMRTALGADPSVRKNMLLLIDLRWLAVAGQVITIAVVGFGFGVSLPYVAMGLVLLGLVALNLLTLRWLAHREEVPRSALFVALLFDVAALTAQLFMSGGGSNPFAALYLLQVTLGAVLLDARAAWILVSITSACYIGLTLEYEPLAVPGHSDADLFHLHTLGLLTCFALVAALLVVLITRIGKNLRERDQRIAALRQRAVEEDHIVRMGLLASGAAHELGTPLSSLSVILNDWQRVPAIAGDPDLVQEIDEMQVALKRCKSILTGILVSAGEARGEAPVVTTVAAFVREVAADWRGQGVLLVRNHFGDDLPIVSDPALKQVIQTVLDNALDASPEWVELRVEREDDTLVISVLDIGPGFAAEMLANFGRPYNSTKGRAGGGLGLFLVVNVVRKLGGQVDARNRPGGGARVTLRLPLAALALE
ncbi:ATP-binding protein [Acuticoccus kandeliae]|uniref:ATP-binding protein n=1 Tax=Acuticoccus kandeliae TaxID=2073160 RepID=UPI0014741E6C|nr:ATP-binding protein [Acuticoccus kandeliae]